MQDRKMQNTEVLREEIQNRKKEPAADWPLEAS